MILACIGGLLNGALVGWIASEAYGKEYGKIVAALGLVCIGDFLILRGMT